MDWSHGHNNTIHNGIGRIGFFSGGHKARWRDEDLADTWVAESKKWIENNRGAPFFLFFSSHDIHVPRMPHERFQGKTSLGYRGDAIAELDWCVGQLLETLDRLNLAENTLVIFCSDNGPVLDDGYKDAAVEKLGDHKPAGPYRGGKYSVYEGGTRTPFIARWPKTIRPGLSSQIVCTIDLASSLAALTGQDLPFDACLDSFNVLPALLGETGAAGRDHLVEQGTSGLALRLGDWKLVRHSRPAGKPVRQREANCELYNLAEDPCESTDVIEKYPMRAEELKLRLQKIEANGRSRS
jgi:arylsulfatase A